MTAINTPTTGMRGDIQKQWSKFTYEEVTALKSKDELVAKVQTKYALDKMQAQRTSMHSPRVGSSNH